MQIQNPVVRIPTKEEPSKWWAWSLAIIILLWSLFGAIGAVANFYLANSGLFDEAFTQAKDGLGPYPENGTSAEQKEWNETHDFLEMMGDDLTSFYQPELQLQFSLIVLFIAFIASFLLFTRDPNGFKAAGIWLASVAITGTIIQVITLTKLEDFYENIPGIDAPLMAGIATGFSIGASLTCYLSVFAFIYIAAKRSSKQEDKVTESGFHSIYNPKEE
tara:strand:+ start:1607 stop:2260 length:654 start_codon:yes stop_codon:yes gene_type:complete